MTVDNTIKLFSYFRPQAHTSYLPFTRIVRKTSSYHIPKRGVLQIRNPASAPPSYPRKRESGRGGFQTRPYIWIQGRATPDSDPGVPGMTPKLFNELKGSRPTRAVGTQIPLWHRIEQSLGEPRFCKEAKDRTGDVNEVLSFI